MPLYRYECESCGNQFKILARQPGQADAPVCPKCGSDATRRMVSRVAIQFKGSGYYKTDYAHKGKVGSAGTKASGSSESKSSADSKDGSTAASSATPEKTAKAGTTKEAVASS
ncbi:zinc ribbon domain-containing protein [Candidatus Bipolaricaulota bacterium]|nr:zinc ribbon domain-containing protein [Candidatus Bipolaricaulota bacterium]